MIILQPDLEVETPKIIPSMKSSIFKICFLVCLLFSNFSMAQEFRQAIGLIGFARIEFGVPNSRFPTSFSAGLNFAFHREIRVSTDFYVDIAFQPGITLYQRGMGTSTLEYSKADRSGKIDKDVLRQSASSQIDLVNAVSMTIGGKKSHSIQIENRTFNYFHRSAIIHNYSSSLTLGSNFITNFNGRNQQIGFAKATIEKLSVGYYNDGTPFNFIFTGDGRDRWWTGGGFLQYGNDIIPTGSTGDRFSFAVGFDRFTGYSYGMFELGNLLRQSFVLHRDPRQYFLNSGRMYLVMNDLKRDYSVTASFNNIPWLDVQNLIHNKGSMSKHYSLLKESYSIGVNGFYPIKL